MFAGQSGENCQGQGYGKAAAAAQKQGTWSGMVWVWWGVQQGVDNKHSLVAWTAAGRNRMTEAVQLSVLAMS
jgi:hypothetical protein